jgi:hypothetical protein
MYHIVSQNVPYWVTKCNTLCHKIYHIASQKVPHFITTCTILRPIMHCAQPSSGPPLSQGILGGCGRWRQLGRYVNSKLQKTASFIVVDSLDVPTQHAQTHTHTLTSYPLPWYFRKIRLDNVFCLSVTARCQNSKSGRYRLTEASKSWLANTRRATNVSFSIGRQTSFLLKPPISNNGC